MDLEYKYDTHFLLSLQLMLFFSVEDFLCVPPSSISFGPRLTFLFAQESCIIYNAEVSYQVHDPVLAFQPFLMLLPI